MAYTIHVDPPAQESIAVLPESALLALSEALSLLELSPWAGASVNPELNPEGPVRNLPFGAAGMVTYLVLEERQEVDILLITWVD